MESNGDLERRDSISNLIERLAAELAPDGSGGGQYSPFGSAAPPPPPPHWQTGVQRAPHPHAGSHPLLGGGPLHFGAPPPHAHPPPYQTDRLSGGPPPDPEGELGTAQLSDNLAAHLAGFDAPLFDPRQPPPPAPPGSFLSSWFGGWLGYSPQVPPADLVPPSPPPPPPQHHHTLVERRCAPQVAEVIPPPSPPPPQQSPQQSQQQQQQPQPSPQRQQPQSSEPCCADPAAAPPSPPPPAPPSPPAAAAPAVPSRPSYSAVLSKPAPAAGPGPRPADTATRQPPGRADSDTPGASGSGSRRGGRGRRRRVSEAEGRPAREEPSAQPVVGEGAPPRPAQTEPREETAEQKKAKSKKLTRTVSAGDAVGSAAAERRADTLNNNPDRAQPPAQRRPLNYNNNLGSSSTLGPAQTHVHAPPPPSPPPPQQQPPVAGDAAKKIDVNVGKQKNCAGKTSNETKKVDATLSKPDNKTLSQSRGPPPVNLLSSSSGSASKSERKELAFRARAGGRTGAARGRRAADGGGVGGELVRRLRVQLAPGAALLTAFLSWLLHLVLDVAAMSAELLWTAALGAVRSTRQHVTQLVEAGRATLVARRDAVRAWLAARRGRAAADARRPAGLQENIALPATGDEAMGRLLACRDSDPYSILGVTHDCTDAEIKRYYRRQALLVHPDKSRSPGADEAFKILQRAFQLVGEPDKRAAFDSEAREQHEVNEAFRQYMDEMMSRLREKMEETQNTLRCNNCSRRHRRSRVERPVYAARTCASCQIRHAAREGDIWAESGWLGLFWRYYACMDGGVFDISEWAACQSQSLKHLQANHHTVQYRIISGAKRHRQPADTEPSDRDLEDLLNNLCGGGGGASMSGETAQQGRRRGARRRPQ